MAAPLITVGSYVSINTGTTASGTLSIPVSAAGNDRIVVVTCTAKDNSSPAADISSINFDPTGVNLSIGAGVSRVGARQLAQESTFSSQCDLYIIKEADLPLLAGTFSCPVSLDSAPQYGFWEAWEITGADQVIDALTEISDIANVSAGADFSSSVVSTVVDCLIIDIWATSHSAAPTFAVNQNQLGTQSGTNGGTVISWINKAAIGSQTMTENSSTLHQRRAGKILSIAPVSVVAALDANLDITVEDTVNATVVETEQRLNYNLTLEDTSVSIQASLEQDVVFSVILGDTITSILASEEGAVSLGLILEDTIPSILSNVESNISNDIILADTTVSILASEEGSAALDIALENTIVSISSNIEENINFNIVLSDTIVSILSGSQSGVNLNTLLEATTAAIQVQNILDIVANITLDNTVASIQASVGDVSSVSLNTILEDTVPTLNVSTELDIILNSLLEDTVSSLLVGQELDITLGISLQDSQVSIVVSGVILTRGSFTRTVSGSSVFTKTVKGNSSFIKGVAA